MGSLKITLSVSAVVAAIIVVWKSFSVNASEIIYNLYQEAGRLDRYSQLVDQYDGNQIILYFNSGSDKWWIFNFSIWLVSVIIPDFVSTALAAGGVYAFFVFMAWWLTVTLTGGGILAVLAWVGSKGGIFTGIPPVMMGVLWIGMMAMTLYSGISMIIG